MTNVINKAHQNHTRVVLTVQSFAWSSGGSTKQKALLGSATAGPALASNIARQIRDRGADGVNLDFEPLAAGYADEFVLAREARPHRARRRRQGLPADVRHDRLHRQLPDRGRDGGRRRRRDLHHGLRLPLGRLEPGRFDRARSAGRRTTSSTPSTPTGRACRRPSSSSACRTTAAPGRRPPTSSTPSNTSGTKFGASNDGDLRDRHRRPRRSTAGASTPSTASPGRPTAARTARSPTAASRRGGSCTWTTRTALQAPSTTSSTTTACAAPASGRSATTTPAPSCGRDQGQVRQHDPVHRRDDFALAIEWLYTSGITSGCTADPVLPERQGHPRPDGDVPRPRARPARGDDRLLR